jgi:hypothetical protein
MTILMTFISLIRVLIIGKWQSFRYAGFLCLPVPYRITQNTKHKCMSFNKLVQAHERVYLVDYYTMAYFSVSKLRKGIKIKFALSFYLIFIVMFSASTLGCEDLLFEGFGIKLGSMKDFAQSPAGTVNKVLEQVYMDLGVR